MRFFPALLMLMASASLFSQEDCNLFNIQDLAAENLALHDSIAQFSVDTVMLQPDGSFEVYLSNGTTYTQVQGCTDAAVVNYDPAANTDDGSCSSCSSSIEFDGHTYSPVEIGDQCWFSENLRTTVYANSDAIPAGLTDGEWSTTSSGATAVYGEDDGCNNYSPDIDACDEAQSLGEYGRLYNWYAVDDPRGLCPSGWHVPTDGEWTDLENYITSQGFSLGTEGTALKSTSGWNSGGNGTDNFGFSALPGGYRAFHDGYFVYAGTVGHWWSSSPIDVYAWERYLHKDDGYISPNADRPRSGFSVRCLRDAD